MNTDTRPFRWDRWTGYEVSSKGDARFSALQARMPDGRTIEEIYQCSIKGYGGTDWRVGKGKPPLDLSVDLWSEYYALWWLWANNNLPLMRELYANVRAHTHNSSDGTLLSDMFAKTEINQARALAQVLNDLCHFPVRL